MATIEPCSCSESLFLRRVLNDVENFCEDDTSVYFARLAIRDVALAALSESMPGGAPLCSCAESQHLRRGLRACLNVTAPDNQASEDGAFGACDDLAQANNFADQALRLAPIEGDPGVYDPSPFIPAMDGAALLGEGKVKRGG